MGEQVVKMTSTLVETVSINYEDFNESFLTCGTCLCTYDGAENTPKLLPCSHTVCLNCLIKIAASATNTNNSSSNNASASFTSSATSTASLITTLGTPREQSSTFRCPICRELIHVPRGGVPALPPSFLVNQLLDLMASQRREVIPKCSTHSSQELLFCETCDSVFCALCTSSPHNSAIPQQSGDHTVIPFSIAIKRMSEILLYKANECLAKLGEASDSVSEEIKRLNTASESAETVTNKAFEDAALLLEKQRQNYIGKIREVTELKKEKLKEQLELIEKEKAKVRETCDGLEYQVEVRHITKRISELTSQLDSFTALRHPRENAYLLCKTESDLSSLESAVNTNIRTSTTFPPLCTISLSPTSFQSVGIEMELILEARDYHNHLRKEGGDPIRVDIQCPKKLPPLSPPQITIQDNQDGTYSIRFTPIDSGSYEVHVEIFGRPISNDNFIFEVSEHNNPIVNWGKGELCQPVSICKSGSGDGHGGEIYILDTGNARIVVLDSVGLKVKRILQNNALDGRSCTGITYCTYSDQILVVNWRSKLVTKITPKDGLLAMSFTHTEFVEPIGIAVDGKGNVFVADNGAKSIFIFDSNGIYKSVIYRERFSVLGGLCVSPDGRTLGIGDVSILLINLEDGNEKSFDREIKVDGKGRFSGIWIDSWGNIIVTRTDKSKSTVQVFNKDLKLVTVIDSWSSKLKRPSDLLVLNEKNVLVVDLGNDSVKQYRYR